MEPKISISHVHYICRHTVYSLQYAARRWHMARTQQPELGRSVCLGSLVLVTPGSSPSPSPSPSQGSTGSSRRPACIVRVCDALLDAFPEPWRVGMAQWLVLGYHYHRCAAPTVSGGKREARAHAMARLVGLGLRFAGLAWLFGRGWGWRFAWWSRTRGPVSPCVLHARRGPFPFLPPGPGPGRDARRSKPPHDIRHATRDGGPPCAAVRCGAVRLPHRGLAHTAAGGTRPASRPATRQKTIALLRRHSSSAARTAALLACRVAKGIAGEGMERIRNSTPWQDREDAPELGFAAAAADVSQQTGASS